MYRKDEMFSDYQYGFRYKRESVKAIGTKLSICFLWSPQHDLMTSSDVGITSWFQNGSRLESTILDFWLFPKPSKTVTIGQKVIKSSKTLKRYKNVKVSENYLSVMVVMATSDSMNNDMSHQIVRRQNFRKSHKLCCLLLSYWKNYKRSKSAPFPGQIGLIENYHPILTTSV